MKVKEVSNFYFFKLETHSQHQLKGVYLLVGSAGFPSEPRPVMKPAIQFADRREDYFATREKRIQAARKFVSKNNVYRYMTIENLNAIGGEIGHEERWGSFITWSSIVSPETKDDVPLRIGDRKTDPGSYYFLGKNLYLAESGDDVLKHVTRNTEPTENKAPTRERIPDETQIFVWNRDGGSCVKCGSRENLAFDHIIPHSLGGSNSRRNLQLLCDSCNLKKSNKIGG